jgi:hypothetical protein
MLKLYNSKIYHPVIFYLLKLGFLTLFNVDLNIIIKKKLKITEIIPDWGN